MLEKRVEKLEEALTPPGAILTVERYPCESDDDLHRKVRQALGRPSRQGDLWAVIELQHLGFECPPGPHVHEDEVKIWRR